VAAAGDRRPSRRGSSVTAVRGRAGALSPRRLIESARQLRRRLGAMPGAGWNSPPNSVVVAGMSAIRVTSPSRQVWLVQYEMPSSRSGAWPAHGVAPLRTAAADSLEGTGRTEPRACVARESSPRQTSAGCGPEPPSTTTRRDISSPAADSFDVTCNRDSGRPPDDVVGRRPLDYGVAAGR
jgi:hypothetical protein